MAPTKAMAAYAATTLTLLTKGPSEVIAKSPSFDVTARSTLQASKAFPAQKGSDAALSPVVHGADPGQRG